MEEELKVSKLLHVKLLTRPLNVSVQHVGCQYYLSLKVH